MKRAKRGRPAIVNLATGSGDPPSGSFYYNAPSHVVVCSLYFKATNKTETSQQRPSRSRVRA